MTYDMKLVILLHIHTLLTLLPCIFFKMHNFRPIILRTAGSRVKQNSMVAEPFQQQHLISEIFLFEISALLHHYSQTV